MKNTPAENYKEFVFIECHAGKWIMYAIVSVLIILFAKIGLFITSFLRNALEATAALEIEKVNAGLLNVTIGSGLSYLTQQK